MNNQLKCPLCDSNSYLKYKLQKNLIITQLGNYFDSTCPQNIIECDYSICKCGECEFEFSNPQIEGNELFYNWITKFEKYYNTHRWEYDFLENFINKGCYNSILDVGCGNGVFFDVISVRNKIEVFGLDLSKRSIEVCQQKGYFNTYKSTLVEYLNSNPNLKFDLITSFHVLEHISNPITFVSDLVSLLSKNGVIFISTPYSPMSFEYEWFDVLNNPPHHLGRYNLRAYEKIAEQLNLRVNFYFPETHNPFSAAIESLVLSLKTNILHSKFDIIKIILKNPFKYSKHLIHQFRRDKKDGFFISNVILVKLTK